MNVPFFRCELGDEEVAEVNEVLRSGWLTTGPKVKRFEAAFAESVGARYSVALASGTAALHLAAEALGLEAGQAVLTPTLTFAATAEIVRYFNAYPILVDCDLETLNLDLEDAERKLRDAQRGGLCPGTPGPVRVAGIIVVHVGGFMLDMDRVRDFAARRGLWVIEDAAHSFPAAYRATSTAEWRRCGEDSSDVTCYSFYPNKTITTGEGGMAVTARQEIAARMRTMSLHGLSADAWGRNESVDRWDYRIVAPGFKYNLTDIAAAVGIGQLKRAEDMRLARERVARRYLESLSKLEEIELPRTNKDRIHSWHLFPIRLRLERLTIDRREFIRELGALGIGTSVHWRPLHLHPYYEEHYGWRRQDLPVASSVWERLISLPIFSTMRDEEVGHVINGVEKLCRWYRTGQPVAAATRAAGA
jgi:perosamine synthetase